MTALSFNDLPVKQATDNPSLFGPWKQLVTLFETRDQFPKMAALLDRYVSTLRILPRWPLPISVKPVPSPLPGPIVLHPGGGALPLPFPPTPEKDPLPAIKALADGLGLSPDTIQDAAQTLLGIKDLAQYRDPLKLDELLRLIDAVKRLLSQS